jgi:hypothetical protein
MVCASLQTVINRALQNGDYGVITWSTGRTDLDWRRPGGFMYYNMSYRNREDLSLQTNLLRRRGVHSLIKSHEHLVRRGHHLLN